MFRRSTRAVADDVRLASVDIRRGAARVAAVRRAGIMAETRDWRRRDLRARQQHKTMTITLGRNNKQAHATKSEAKTAESDG
jgi:hypothetical protein